MPFELCMRQPRLFFYDGGPLWRRWRWSHLAKAMVIKKGFLHNMHVSCQLNPIAGMTVCRSLHHAWSKYPALAPWSSPQRLAHQQARLCRLRTIAPCSWSPEGRHTCTVHILVVCQQHPSASFKMMAGTRADPRDCRHGLVVSLAMRCKSCIMDRALSRRCEDGSELVSLPRVSLLNAASELAHPVSLLVICRARLISVASPKEKRGSGLRALSPGARLCSCCWAPLLMIICLKGQNDITCTAAHFHPGIPHEV